VKLDCNGKTLDLAAPVVMGVLNVTPDSFSDGGKFVDAETAVAHALRMVDEGAAIIDIGGESTRPGAAPVSEQQEMERVLPIIERLAHMVDAVISIDTMKPSVMREAVKAGAGLINDVNALQAEGALKVAAESAAGLCLMHMQGEPRSMQKAPHYNDVLSEVADFLQQRAKLCEAAGIARNRILIDPGFGFGKTLEHNLRLMAELERFTSMPWPVLVGVSRKSMLGALLDVPPAERVHGGTAAAVLACWQGAKIVRTHDVRAAWQALQVMQSVRRYKD